MLGCVAPLLLSTTMILACLLDLVRSPRAALRCLCLRLPVHGVPDGIIAQRVWRPASLGPAPILPVCPPLLLPCILINKHTRGRPYLSCGFPHCVLLPYTNLRTSMLDQSVLELIRHNDLVPFSRACPKDPFPLHRID
jgi:hypothetical protein